jgi:hypothetical protein
MELVNTRETTERPSDAGSRAGPEFDRVTDLAVDLQDGDVESAWLLKTRLRWVRDDRNPLNAFRWFFWNRFGVGDPPSRVIQK